MGTNFRSFILFMLPFLSTANSQGYYPLEIGNVWEYWDTTWDEYLFTIRATADTIIPSGLQYTVVESGGNFGYRRQSGSKVYYYDPTLMESEFLVYDFSKTTGDTVTINYYPGDTIVVTVVYDRMANVFGEMRRQWGFWAQSIISSAYTLTQVTDSMGVTWQSWEAAPYDIYLRGAIINGTTYGTLTSEGTFDLAYLEDYQLFPNYPNPFNSSTVIRFRIPEQAYIVVTIFDVMGRQVRKLFSGKRRIGLHQIVWDGTDDLGIKLGTGSYIYTIKTENFVSSNKMTLLR